MDRIVEVRIQGVSREGRLGKKDLEDAERVVLSRRMSETLHSPIVYSVGGMKREGFKCNDEELVVNSEDVQLGEVFLEEHKGEEVILVNF